MSFLLSSAIFFFGLFFAGLMLALELGRRVRLREIRAKQDVEPARFSIADGAVFGLMGLLLAFTFAAAGGRFEARRQLLVDEANAVGTAWLRLDLLPDSARRPLQASFRQYVDARLAGYRAMPDTLAARREFTRAAGMQQAIWSGAVAATEAAPTPAPSLLLLPALNAMFDIATTRMAAMRAHLPGVIFGLLFFLVLCCGVLAGYGMTHSGPRNWLHTLGFAAVFVITLYVIADYEYPRWGFINLASSDRPLIEVRQGMGD
jgi:hypothetical protein